VELITFLAIWGAVVSTGLAIWDGYKWIRMGRAELSVSANGGMFSTVRSDKQTYVLVHVTNVGDRPTTLQLLTFRYYQAEPKNFKIAPDKQGVFNLFTSYLQGTPPPLPKKLETGEVWSNILPQTPDLEEMAREGFLYIEAAHSLGQKPFKNPRARLILKD